MLRCHLATLIARHHLRVTDVARATGLNRSTITALQRQTASRIDLMAIDRLCALFQCPVGELFEFVPDAADAAVAHTTPQGPA